MSLAVTALALALGASAPLCVRPAVSAEVPCALAEKLPAALAALDVSSDAASCGWALRVRREGEQVEVALLDGREAAQGKRRLSPTPADCAAFPRTVALLAKTWLTAATRDRPVAETPRPSSPPARTVEAQPEADAPRPSSPPARMVDAQPITDAPRPSPPPARTVEAQPITDAPRSSSPPARPTEPQPSADAARARAAPTASPAVEAPRAPPQPTPALEAPRSAALAPSVETPPVPPTPRPSAEEPPSAAIPESIEEKSSAPESEPVAASTEPVPTPAAEPAPAPAPPAIAASKPEPAPSPESARPSMSFSVLLAGGAGIAPADQFIGSFTLGLEWGFREPFALGVDVGLDTLRVGQVTEGRVSLLVHWATLYGRVVLFARGLTGLHIQLGGRLVRMSAWSEGFTENKTADLYGGAAVLALEWRQELTRHLLFFGRLGVQARFQPETFSIGGVGTVLTLPPWGFWAQVGGSWNFL